MKASVGMTMIHGEKRFYVHFLFAPRGLPKRTGITYETAERAEAAAKMLNSEIERALTDVLLRDGCLTYR